MTQQEPTTIALTADRILTLLSGGEIEIEGLIPWSSNATLLVTVRDEELYLGGAIDSILAQSFSDFEFLILDDASSDESRAIIASCDDPRIRLIENEQNLGLADRSSSELRRSPREGGDSHPRACFTLAFLDNRPSSIYSMSGEWKSEPAEAARL